MRVLCATTPTCVRTRPRDFPADLYFRLNVIELNVPPLRERREDVVPLAESFLQPPKSLGAAARNALLSHDWPGNVRELQNRILRATVISAGDVITPEDLGFGESRETTADVPVERSQIEIALLNANGSVSRAAEALGVSRQALYRRMEKLGDRVGAEAEVSVIRARTCGRVAKSQSRRVSKSRGRTSFGLCDFETSTRTPRPHPQRPHRFVSSFSPCTRRALGMPGSRMGAAMLVTIPFVLWSARWIRGT